MIKNKSRKSKNYKKQKRRKKYQPRVRIRGNSGSEKKLLKLKQKI